ncbi:MAG: hypothetical protein NTY61_02325 [Candidatus Parcubacteria bacterium]|nr:hypothetical protein [Candidatus Parcubacteria bacterium]
MKKIILVIVFLSLLPLSALAGNTFAQKKAAAQQMYAGTPDSMFDSISPKVVEDAYFTA